MRKRLLLKEKCWCGTMRERGMSTNDRTPGDLLPALRVRPDQRASCLDAISITLRYKLRNIVRRNVSIYDISFIFNARLIFSRKISCVLAVVMVLFSSNLLKSL